MIGNAAGPVMAIYLLSTRMPKLAFVGTNAWFFLCLFYIKAALSCHFIVVILLLSHVFRVVGMSELDQPMSFFILEDGFWLSSKMPKLPKKGEGFAKNRPGRSGSSNGEMLKPSASQESAYSKAHNLLSGVSDRVPTSWSWYFTLSSSIFIIAYVPFSCSGSCGFVSVLPLWNILVGRIGFLSPTCSPVQ